MDDPPNFPDWMPTPEDVEGILQASRDYIEGWYTADSKRMQRCLHPDLVKRTLERDSQQDTWQLTRRRDARMMVEFTLQGGGSDIPESERTHQIRILDVFRHIACVKVLSHEMMDYLHLAKINERWLIVNVIWELREGELSPDE